MGTQRTSTFLPGEHLVIDSGYMNNSKDQFSKIIILADQCTGRISALPLRNLKSSTVIRMIHLYLCCNVHPKQISCDLGSEYLLSLDQFLQTMGIKLTSQGTNIKSTTSIAELSIRLLKTALRQTSLHDPRLWPQYLPQCIQVINSLPLYDTKVSRNMLFYNPQIYQNMVYAQFGLQGLSHLQQDTKLQHLLQKRKDLLQKQATKFQPRFKKFDLVFLTHQSKLAKHDSNELSPVAHSLHYVTQPGFTSSSICNVFDGSSRRVQNTKLHLLSWTDLVNLRGVLQDHQMADLGKDLLRSNRYLAPDQSKTWKTILDPTDIPDQVFEQLCDDLEHNEQLLPQVEIDSEQQETNDTLEQDDLLESQYKRRTTRSGRTYLAACLSALVRPEPLDDTPTKVSAISVVKPRQSCLVLKRLCKEKKQSVRFS